MDIDKIADHIFSLYPKAYLKKWAELSKYYKYQKDPVAFGEQVLNERYSRDIIQLMNSVRDYNVTVAISANGVGKSFCCATLALWWYKCFPNSQTYTIAAPPLENLKMVLWGEIGKKLSRNKSVFEYDTYNVMHIYDSEWHFIRGLAIPLSGPPEERVGKFSGKHSEHLMFIADEADAIPDEIFTGIENCMSGGNFRLVCLFNPKRLSGYVYRLVRDSKANVINLSAFNHPNVVSGKDLFLGAVTREVTAKRINECSIPLYSEEKVDSFCFEVPDYLVGYAAKNDRGDEYPPLQPGFRRIIDNRFFYQVLGLFPPTTENQLIQKEWVDKARFRWEEYVSKYGRRPPEGVRPILGADIADVGYDSNSICLRYTDWVAPFRRWRGISPNETAERIAEIAKELNAHIVYADSIGIGADVVPLLKKSKIRSERVVVSERPTKSRKEDNKELKFNKLRDQLLWDIRDWIASDSSMIPPDEKLIEELLYLTYEVDSTTGRIRVVSTNKIRNALGRSPDTLMSLAMTFAPSKPGPRVRIV